MSHTEVTLIASRIGENVRPQRVSKEILVISERAAIANLHIVMRLIREMLAKYADEEEIEKILEIAGSHTLGLLFTTFYVERVYGRYGGPRLVLLEFEEDYEEMGRKWAIIGLVLRDCGYREWNEIERKVKTWMREQNLEELAGKVLVVCAQGLKEMLS